VTKKEHAIISAGTKTGGLVLFGLAMTGAFGHSVSTLCIVVGLGFAVGGFISLILALKRQS